MIISRKTSVKDLNISSDYKNEHYLHTPINTGRAMVGFEDFANSINLGLVSKKDLSLIRHSTGGMPKIDEGVVNVLEQSIAAHGYTVTQHINPLEPEKKLAFTSTRNFWIGMMYLAMMVIAWSMNGPLTLSLTAGHPLIKATWRTQGNLIIMCSASMFLYTTNPNMSFKQDFTFQNLWKTMYAASLGFVWGVGMILGCSLTITSHALVMNLSTGVYILFFSLIVCAKVHKFELWGYAVYAFGVYMMFTDPHAVKTGAKEPSLLGALIPFLGAGFGAMQGFLNSKDTGLHPVIKMTQFNLVGVIYQWLFFPLFVQDSRFYSMDPVYGAWGWFTNISTFTRVLFVVSPISGFIGNMGYFFAFKYFPMQIIAAAILIEPFTGQVAGILIGQDTIPGIKTILGLTIITIGCLIASYGATKKQEEAIKQIIEESVYYEQELHDKKKSTA